jgi:hypothetical protein
VKDLQDIHEIQLIPIGEKVVFFRGVKSRKIPEGKIGIVENYKYIAYLNKKSGEREYAVLYDVRLPNGKIHRTQARCIMPLADWENPSVREAMLKKKGNPEDPIMGKAWLQGGVQLIKDGKRK